MALWGAFRFGQTLWGATLADGGKAYDFQSYWLAGRHLLSGTPLYQPVEINDPGAYRYLPTFAVAMVPVSLLPEAAATWLYRLGCMLCLRYLVGSWRAVGWSLLFPPVPTELMALNVTLPMAAAMRWALRGPDRVAALITPLAALKYGAALMLPFLWFRQPTRRRAITVGAVTLAVVVGVHVLVDPPSWQAFAGALVQQSASPNNAPYVGEQLMFLVPSTFWDFVLRFALGAALTAVAIWRNWAWLAFAAAILAVPTLWLARLAPLVALPLLFVEDLSAGSREEWKIPVGKAVRGGQSVSSLTRPERAPAPSGNPAQDGPSALRSDR